MVLHTLGKKTKKNYNKERENKSTNCRKIDNLAMFNFMLSSLSKDSSAVKFSVDAISSFYSKLLTDKRHIKYNLC